MQAQIKSKYIDMGDAVRFWIRGPEHLIEKVGTVVWIGTANEAKEKFNLRHRPRRRQAQIQTEEGELFMKQLTSIVIQRKGRK